MIDYNKDVTKLHKALSREEQKQLCVLKDSGDLDARDKIIYSCMPMVVNIAKKFRINNKHIDLEDFVQEGNIALMAAVQKWDYSIASITTIATWYIRNAMIDMIHDGKYKIKNPLSMSRRASEELSKIKRIGTKNIDEIHEKTNINKKRISHLMSCDANKRYDTYEVENDLIQEDDYVKKPCIADLIDLAEEHLDNEHCEIFFRWSGIRHKKQGIKKISEDMNMSRKEAMSKLSFAKRQLTRVVVDLDA